jgi:hypothetical protein
MPFKRETMRLRPHGCFFAKRLFANIFAKEFFGHVVTPYGFEFYPSTTPAPPLSKLLESLNENQAPVYTSAGLPKNRQPLSSPCGRRGYANVFSLNARQQPRENSQESACFSLLTPGCRHSGIMEEAREW